MEKLLEDALIKMSAVAHPDTLSVRDMVEALIAGERNPRLLAGLARGRMKVKHGDLVEALTGQFDEHHAELARMLLDQIDALSTQIDTLTARIDALLTAIWNPNPEPTTRTRPAALAGSPAAPASRHHRATSTRFPVWGRTSRRSSSPRSGWT